MSEPDAASALTKAQLDDFAELLASYVNVDNIAALATYILGADALADAGNDVGDAAALARRIVELLAAAGRIPDAIARLRVTADPNSRLVYGLNYILTGGRLDDGEAKQGFINKYEPFISAGGFQDTFARLMRTVCAIGLGGQVDSIVGSGFLVGPDLVMTNYHVLKPFVTTDANGKVIPNGPGNQIVCFFDYLWRPEPTVTPNAAIRHTALAIPAADDWLVHGQPELPGDGTATCPKGPTEKHDYVVLKLSRAVGRLAARASAGIPRGWLSLPGSVKLYENRRVIVHQHPSRAPQQFDIGDYKQVDPTGTRVWYTVSTAHGSSGGAAVDAEGQLFALHNAEVIGSDPKMNQGVRIDLIAQDLAANVPTWPPNPAPAESPMSFWSLSDTKEDPKPIIGRTGFRSDVHAMNEPGGVRVMVVSGPVGSGRRFSFELLSRSLGAQRPVVRFSPEKLAILEPQQFVRALVQRLNIPGLSARPRIPDPKSSEDMPRWMGNDLPQWLADRLAEDEQRDQSRYPAWVVLDTIVPDELNEPFVWAGDLLDAIMVMVGVRDEAKRVIDIPQLRWAFLVAESQLLPFGDLPRRQDDLRAVASYRDEFVDCLRLAWRSVDRESEIGDGKPWRNLAAANIRNVPQPRKVLSDLVRTIITAPPEDV